LHCITKPSCPVYQHIYRQLHDRLFTIHQQFPERPYC
jgi:hypothetical protein